jgi:hypothetical protein
MTDEQLKPHISLMLVNSLSATILQRAVFLFLSVVAIALTGLWFGQENLYLVLICAIPHFIVLLFRAIAEASREMDSENYQVGYWLGLLVTATWYAMVAYGLSPSILSFVIVFAGWLFLVAGEPVFRAIVMRYDVGTFWARLKNHPKIGSIALWAVVLLSIASLFLFIAYVLVISFGMERLPILVVLSVVFGVLAIVTLVVFWPQIRNMFSQVNGRPVTQAVVLSTRTERLGEGQTASWDSIDGPTKFNVFSSIHCGTVVVALSGLGISVDIQDPNGTVTSKLPVASKIDLVHPALEDKARSLHAWGNGGTLQEKVGSLVVSLKMLQVLYSADNSISHAVLNITVEDE